MEIFALPLSLRVVLVTAILFGFAPALMVRLIALMWPRGHGRRLELRAEIAYIDYWKRPLWAAEQLETALFDGLPQQWRERRCRLERAALIFGPRALTRQLSEVQRLLADAIEVSESELRVAYFARHRRRFRGRDCLARVASVAADATWRPIRWKWRAGQGIVGRTVVDSCDFLVLDDTGLHQLVDARNVPTDIRQELRGSDLHDFSTVVALPARHPGEDAHGCLTVEFRRGAPSTLAVTEAAEILLAVLPAILATAFVLDRRPRRA